MTISPLPRRRFGLRFSLVARRWRREIEQALAGAGLSDATWTPLVHLDETGGGLSQKQLAALVGVDASTLVRLLDILEGRNWIVRRVAPDDARTRLIYLTPEGAAQVLTLRALLDNIEARWLDGIPDEELTVALGVIDRIDARLGAGA